MLIIGGHSKTTGDLLEEFQYLGGKESGRNPQDYFSNELGYKFREKYQDKINSYPTLTTHYLSNFLRDPSYFYIRKKHDRYVHRRY